MRCAACAAGDAASCRCVDGVNYFRCGGCGSLFAEPDFLAQVEASGETAYADSTEKAN